MNALHLSLLLSALTLGSPPSASAALRVVTTTTDLADLVATIGAERVDVQSICSGEQDPHYVQARPSYMVKLSRADLLVAVGLDLEIAWLPSLIEGARNPSINPGRLGYLEASRGIQALGVPQRGVDRSQGDVHARGNPHFWLDPRNVQRSAAAIAERLATLDPEGAATYRRNLAVFDAQLTAALTRWQRTLAPYKGRTVVSYHRTFNYLLRTFGLVAIGYVENRPGIPPALAHLAQLIRQMKSQKVSVLLHENYNSKAPSQLVAKRAGAQLLILPTSVKGNAESGSYILLMDYLVSSIAKALAGAG